MQVLVRGFRSWHHQDCGSRDVLDVNREHRTRPVIGALTGLPDHAEQFPRFLSSSGEVYRSEGKILLSSIAVVLL